MRELEKLAFAMRESELVSTIEQLGEALIKATREISRLQTLLEVTQNTFEEFLTEERETA